MAGKSDVNSPSCGETETRGSQSSIDDRAVWQTPAIKTTAIMPSTETGFSHTNDGPDLS